MESTETKMECTETKMESTETKIDSEEFSKNLKTILSQVVVDKDKAEKLLIKNDNNVLKTIIEILDYKPTNQINENEQNIHKNKIKELRQIMKNKDKLFNEISKKKEN